MGRIVWLASFPKSGNTWVRVLLNNYLQGGETPASINKLDVTLGASSRQEFDAASGVEASEMTRDEIDRCRPGFYRDLAARSNGLMFLKVHDAYGYDGDGDPLFPADVTASVVYIMRNPLDVAVSWAHHEGISLDAAVEAICRRDFALSGARDRLPEQIEQRVGTWSDHVQSWVDRSGLSVQIVRYEDLACDPEPAFGDLVSGLGLVRDPDRVSRAVRLSRFDELRRQEEQAGFIERSPTSTRFFRKGEAGDWRNVLSPRHVAQVTAAHAGVMRRFGYSA